MGKNLNDDIDQRMTAWLSSVSQGYSEETRFSLLSSALDAFLERFEQENGPISAIGRLSLNDTINQEPQSDTDVQSRKQESDKNETTSCNHAHLTVSDTDAPLTDIDEVVESSIGVSESEPSLSSQPNIGGVPGTLSTVLSGESSGIGSGVKQQSEKRLKRKRKHHSHKHEHHATTKKARLDFNNNISILDNPPSEDLNNNCCSLDDPEQDNNNNHSSLDARLEQFFVCPQTNCLIPKQTQPTDLCSVRSAPDSAEHKHRQMKSKLRGEKAKYRCENIKPRQEKPRLRGHKKERSLLKAATIRCLVRKALETGTYCCYRRCFLARPRLYV